MPRRTCHAGALILLWGCGAPQRPESQTPFELGRDAARIKDYSTAVTQLTVAINNARDYVFTGAYLERGECYLRVATGTEDATARDQNLLAALDDFNLVLKEPELPNEEKARAYVLLGRTFLAKSDVKSAEETFQKIFNLDLQPPDRHFRLDAHRQLGWILLERARLDRKPDETAEESLEFQEHFRKAQEHFSRGLEIQSEDEECNLGKGICLHFRGQDREAIAYLQKSTQLSEAANTPNPRGHYHLALALELQKGYQEKALEHYRRAAEQDSRQSFTPLYEHLVRVLLVYVPFEDPQFRWFFDNMLAYTGGDPSYWTSVEEFAGRLASGTAPAMQEAGNLARAVARARNLKIDAAVVDALHLIDQPNFSQLLTRIFPNQPRRPEFLYGRALTLFGAKRHTELASFFEEPALRSPDPSLIDNDFYQKALVIEGKNIVALWLEKVAGRSSLTDQEKTERDSFLSKAVSAFQGYLTKHPEDRDVALSLGEAQELADEYSKASLKYAEIGKANPEDTEAFRRLARLHSARLLNAQQMTEGWIALLGYAGKDTEILDYVRRTEEALRVQALLYCKGCGRKGSEGDLLCLECGKQIGARTDTGKK